MSRIGMRGSTLDAGDMADTPAGRKAIEDERDKYHAALQQAEAAIRELVAQDDRPAAPQEPTPEMIVAGANATIGMAVGSAGAAIACYKAMLAAAPSEGK